MNTPRTTFYEDFSIAEFPSPTGVNHYEYKVIELIKAKEKQFPSPTGVNHYECDNVGDI